MHSVAVAQRQLSGGVSLQDEIPAPRDARGYVEARLVADPHAITPLTHVTRDFNAWWAAPPRWAVCRVRQLLRAAGLPITSADFRGRYGVAAVSGWRIATDPGISDLLLRLQPSPGDASTVETVTAAFNATAPIGGAWTDIRMADVLRGLGFAVALKRRDGVISVFIENCRLTGSPTIRNERRRPKLPPKTNAPLVFKIADINLHELTAPYCRRLVQAGVTTRDELADLAADELQEIIGADLAMETAQKIIMAARAHWYADEAAAS